LSVHQFEGLADGGSEAVQRQMWQRPIGLGSHNVGDDPAVPRMMAQWRGWPHRTGGDGEDALCRPYVTASSWASAELVAALLSRVPPSSFEGREVEEVPEWVTQCHGMTPAFPHSTRTTLGMAAQCGLVEQRQDLIPQAVSEDPGYRLLV
jgi:hypothetical protein